VSVTKPRIIGRKRVYEGWSKLDVFTLAYEADGVTHELKREVHDHGNGVAVLAYDVAARTAVLVRQFRLPPHLQGEAEPLLEVIAGLRDVDGESPEDCVRREAVEEAGLVLDGLEPVAGVFVSPGAINESLFLYLAEIDGAVPRGVGGGVEGEHEGIEVVEVPLAELARQADAGTLKDMKTLLLVQTLRLRHPELFA
jgi:nudix-type nucleoside diphosphatase (YffH/AdpP family)